MYPPTGTSFLCHSLYLNNVNLVLTDVNCIFFYILSKSSPFAPSQSVFIHSCKVWEHKGISKEIKQALCTGNQYKRTFTRSPAWVLRCPFRLARPFSGASDCGASDSAGLHAFFMSCLKIETLKPIAKVVEVPVLNSEMHTTEWRLSTT